MEVEHDARICLSTRLLAETLYLVKYGNAEHDLGWRRVCYPYSPLPCSLSRRPCSRSSTEPWPILDNSYSSLARIGSYAARFDRPMRRPRKPARGSFTGPEPCGCRDRTERRENRDARSDSSSSRCLTRSSMKHFLHALVTTTERGRRAAHLPRRRRPFPRGGRPLFPGTLYEISKPTTVAKFGMSLRKYTVLSFSVKAKTRIQPAYRRQNCMRRKSRA